MLAKNLIFLLCTGNVGTSDDMASPCIEIVCQFQFCFGFGGHEE